MDDGVFNAICAGLVGVILALCASFYATSRPSPPAPATLSTSVKIQPSAVPSPSAQPSRLPLYIFYGTQTGRATELARALEKAAATALPECQPRVLDMSTLAPSSAQLASLSSTASVALFLTSTYGEGDPPDNAAAFVAWLRSAEHSPTLLCRLRYSVFGLGNRQYEHYNRAGKVVNARLEALGGVRVYRHGEGDDDGDLEEDFEQWKGGGLWEALRGAAREVLAEAGASLPTVQQQPAAGTSVLPPALPLRVRLLPAPQPPLPPHCTATYQVALPASQLLAAAQHAHSRGRHFFTARPLACTVSRELRTLASPGASTRHLELALAGSTASYGTADTCLVCPENEPALVTAVAERLGLDPSAWFTLEALVPEQEAAPLFPTPCTVRTALGCFLDIAGPLRRPLAGELAPYAGDKGERETLQRLGAEGADKQTRDLWRMVVTGAASTGVRASASASATTSTPLQPWGLLQLLTAFPSLKPSLEALCQLLPLLTPRAYTIASSPLAHPSTLAIAASHLQGGVCSSYLGRCQAGDTVRCQVAPSTFKLPASGSVPVILVGPGTGVAPMRAFLQERRALKQQLQAGAALPPAVLFFGCRSSEEDYIYREELEAAREEGVLSQLHCAFSRQGGEGSKVYVQHLIAREGAGLWQLLQGQQAHVYVCGATGMGAGVAAAFQEVSVRAPVEEGAA